jgi:hypothetical protein
MFSAIDPPRSSIAGQSSGWSCPRGRRGRVAKPKIFFATRLAPIPRLSVARGLLQSIAQPVGRVLTHAFRPARIDRFKQYVELEVQKM